MQEILQFIILTFTATSAMTAFSYMASEVFGKLYKEPILLSYLLNATKIQVGDRTKSFLGWIFHYVIGGTFVLIYLLPIWLKLDWYRVNLLSGIIFGIMAGVVGIISWRIMFSLSDREQVKPSGYFAQLFIAHLIFGFVMALTYMAIYS